MRPKIEKQKVWRPATKEVEEKIKRRSWEEREEEQEEKRANKEEENDGSERGTLPR